MDYALILNVDRLGLMQIRTADAFMTIEAGQTEDGRKKFRAVQVGDFIGLYNDTKILFIGTQEECINQLKIYRNNPDL